jgi:hypothetical protein
MAGAVGMGVVAAAIALAGGLGGRLAVGLWVVLAARAVASVPFPRVQVRRRRRQAGRRSVADVSQVATGVVAGVAGRPGALGGSGRSQSGRSPVWNLTRVVPPGADSEGVGVLQLLDGPAVVAATAIGVWCCLSGRFTQVCEYPRCRLAGSRVGGRDAEWLSLIRTAWLGVSC